MNLHPVNSAGAGPGMALSLSMLDRLDQFLKYWALTRGAETAFRFLWAGKEVEQLTFGELDAGARAIAAELATRIDFGQPVLLAYAPGLEFIRAFFGCLYAGLIPVPLELPRSERGVAKLHLVAAISHARWTLSDNRSLAQLASRVGDVDELPFQTFSTDRIAAAPGIGDAQLPQLTAEALALLQFTSGSTGTPKGVMVTHRQLLANQRAIARAFGHDESTVVAGWLPFFHDMGLIGNVLQPIFLGRPCVLMSPQDFIQSPVRWLQAVSEYRATTSGGPNFSYAVCARKVQEQDLRGLDLSSWRLAFNGAEPVSVDAMQSFYERFAAHGFKRQAFYPCYGLAEATLFVCGGHWDGTADRGSAGADMTGKEPHGRAIDNIADATAREPPGRGVNTGRAAEGCEVLIVDPDKRTVQPEGAVGEIWVSGSSVASGYWNEPLVGSIFHSECADWPGRRWLRTGDLGYMCNRDIYPTGRLTDVIGIRGVNHYPADIETTVQRSWPALGASGSVAAFAVDGASETELVVALEFGRGHVVPEQAAQGLLHIRNAIATEHGLALAAAVLLPTGSLPRTSSGKLRRGACRERFAAGDWNDYRLDRLASTEEAAPLKAG